MNTPRNSGSGAYLEIANSRKLSIYLVSMFILGSGYVLYFAVISAWMSFWGPLVFVAGIASAWGLVKSDKPKEAVVLLALALWGGPTWSSLFTGGVWSPIIIWLIPPILIIGFLGGMYASIAVGLLAMISVVGMYLFDGSLAGLNELKSPGILTFTTVASILTGMGFVIFFAVENNRQTKLAITQATKSHEDALKAQVQLEAASEERRKKEASEAERFRKEAQYRERNSRDLSVELEENATRIKSLAKSVREVSNLMSQANQSTKGITEHAREGGRVVEEALTAMRKAQKSSVNIANISSAIEEIATQTNLLALNAQIEAARAGQAGRGFAVVAGEVQALAARAQHAAQDINRLTNDSGKNVNLGAEAVDRANIVLGDIISEVEKTADQISHVAQASINQATMIEDINGAATHIDRRMQELSRPYQQAAE